MLDSGVLKACIAIFVLAALQAPPLASWLTSSGHDCTDHVCRCSGRKPAQGHGAQRCHGAPGPATRGCELRAACRHESSALASALTPGLRYQPRARLSLYAFVPMPIHQRVNEAQLTPKLLVAGFSRGF